MRGTELLLFTNTFYWQIIVKIIILAITHFLAWFPFSVVESLNDLFPDLFHRCKTDIHMLTYYRLMAILILITSMSGVAYPILYCFVSHEFRVMYFSCWLAHAIYNQWMRCSFRNSSNETCGAFAENLQQFLPSISSQWMIGIEALVRMVAVS